MSTPYYLTALGLCCALGDSKETVWANAVKGSRAGMQQRQGFLPDDKAIVVGEVSAVLPDS